MPRRNPNQTIAPAAAPPQAQRRGRGRPPGGGGAKRPFIPGQKSRYMWRCTAAKNAADAQTIMQELSDGHYMIKNQIATVNPAEPIVIVWCHYEGSGPDERKRGK